MHVCVCMCVYACAWLRCICDQPGGTRGSIFNDSSYRVSSSMTNVLSSKNWVTWEETGGMGERHNRFKRLTVAVLTFHLTQRHFMIKKQRHPVYSAHLGLVLYPVRGLLELTNLSDNVRNLREKRKLIENIQSIT